jgi:diaminohydroxyphosphoribosylaminopyrimidine deaminase / 5-amino-6-(5-phosphoribosylamino)uracil reductase
MDYMEIALALAKLAQGQVSPNPAVGAVVVKNNVVLGQGYTQPPGFDHAEIVALKQAGDEARGAVLYVTLEPCCHFGRTPPCTQSIIAAGIAEVHLAMIDPNPLVSGKGLADLQKAGIKTYTGERNVEAASINESFIKYITTGTPFVTVKFAASLDGKIATRSGDSKWITGETARKLVHHMRYISDAVMTGANTVIADDPLLTVRLSDKGGTTRKQPLRIIVDGQGRTPPTSRIFGEPGKTILVVGTHLPPRQKIRYQEAGAELLELPSDEGVIDLADLLQILGKRQITSILVEAGGILLGSLLDNHLVDKVVAFLAPMIIGGEEARPAVAGKGVNRLADSARLKQLKVERLGEDIMISGYVVR